MTQSFLAHSLEAIEPYTRSDLRNALQTTSVSEAANLKLPLRLLLPIEASRPLTNAPHDRYAHGHATLSMAQYFETVAQRGGLKTPAPHARAGHAIIAGLEPGDDLHTSYCDSNARSLIVWALSSEKLVSHMQEHDWRKITKTLKERGGDLHFVIGDSPETAATEVVYACRDRSYALFDGSSLYFSTSAKDPKPIADFIQSLKELLSLHDYSMGHFEDEVLMMRHGVTNLARRDHYQFPNEITQALELPAMIVGSGPSLDECTSKIVETADRSIVFAGGTASGILLGLGIIPDFHCEFENDSKMVEILDTIDPDGQLKNTILIAPPTVDPSMADRFKSVIFFYRDSVTPSRLFAEQHDPPALVGPTVTNTALRAAIGFGFLETVLFGVDLGSRSDESHHSSKSVYLTKEEKGYDPGYAHKSPIAGNRGGTVYTNREFLNALQYFEKLISLCVQQRVYNGSGGALINGAIPVSPSDFNPRVPPRPKSQVIQSILGGLRKRAAGELTAPDRLTAFSNSIQIWETRALEALEAHKGRETYELVSAFASLVQDGQADIRHGVDATVNALFSGTIHEILKAAHFFERRIEEPSLGPFREVRDTALKSAIDTIMRKAEDLAREGIEIAR